MLHRNCFVRYLRAHFCIRNRINGRSKRERSVKCQQLPYRYAHTFPEVFQINATLRNNVVLGGSVSSARRTCYLAVPGSHPIRLYKYRLFAVPYFFVRSFRYTTSYRHGYLDFQMYRGGWRRGL